MFLVATREIVLVHISKSIDRIADTCCAELYVVYFSSTSYRLRYHSWKQMRTLLLRLKPIYDKHIYFNPDISQGVNRNPGKFKW